MEPAIRVLHVDDEPDFADLAAVSLERADDRIAVESVASVDDALNVLDRSEVDCIVSDYSMPGRNGIEFLEAVRKRWPDLPFILYTGKGSEEVASEAISAGVTDYLQKSTGTEQYTVLANRIVNAVESHRSQQALAERNRDLERYEHMIDSMQEAACIYDEEGRFELVNEFLAEWYDTTRDDLVGESSTLIPRIRSRAGGDPYQELLDGDRERLTGRIESEFPAHGYAMLEYQLTPLTVSGTIEGVVGVTRDITERKRRERELERTNALLETLFEALPVGVLAEDTSRDVLTVNQRLVELFGFSESPAEIVGSDCETLAADLSEMVVDPEGFVDRIDERVTDREAVDGEEVTLRDGRTFARSYRPIERPDGHGHLWVYRDVTAREAHKQAIAALHEVATDLAECSSREGVFQRTIDAAESILELDRAAIAVEDDGLLHVEAMSEGVPVDEPPTMAVDDGIAGKTYRTGNGMVVDDVTTASDANPQSADIRAVISVPIGDYGVFQAISDRPNAFDDHDLELAGLLGRHIESALGLLSRERELHRQNERLAEFASVVSHDLRNPLAVARGHLDRIHTDTDRPVHADQDHLEEIEWALDRMDTLIEELLALARDGDQVGQLERTDLVEITECCWRNVATADATLRIDTDRCIRADRSRFQQLLENLVRNAIEHGGGDVTVTVGDLDDGFYVEDDGPGIPETDRDGVFDAGYTNSEGGTGFGLTIVEQVADAHGWTITVTESDHGGARFEIKGVDILQG